MKQDNRLSHELNQTETNPAEKRENGIQPIKASQTSADRRKVIEPRSRAYLHALSTADGDREEREDEVIEKIVKKMPLNNKLIGILAGCKIPGCIIHAIDKEGNILEHYSTEDQIPEALQEGYQVYLQNPRCFSVEVYTLYYCIVYEKGTVKFLERNTGR